MPNLVESSVASQSRYHMVQYIGFWQVKSSGKSISIGLRYWITDDHRQVCRWFTRTLQVNMVEHDIIPFYWLFHSDSNHHKMVSPCLSGKMLSHFSAGGTLYRDLMEHLIAYKILVFHNFGLLTPLIPVFAGRWTAHGPTCQCFRCRDLDV